jgi:tRNA-uridine 2-sulfurtransferase
LSQEQLSQILFPLGELTKREVRELSSGIGLPLSDKEESQDFYSGDYKELLDISDIPGEIVNLQGKVLGHHNGIWNYTVGQRKGLGIAWSEPLYVIGLDKEKNQVIVGIREEGMSTSFLVDDLNWVSVPGLKERMEIRVKIRSAQQEVDAAIEPSANDGVKVVFHHPGDGIAPGQSAVFYDGDTVVGGGTIVNIEEAGR